MVVPKEKISEWLEWVAGWAKGATNVEDVDAILKGYTVAADRSGYDRDLVDRIAAVPSMEVGYGRAAVDELRSIAAEARRRTAEEFPEPSAEE